MEDRDLLEGEGQMMTLLGHIGELKDRLVRIALALVVCSVATMAAFITPTPDWFNMTLVMAPLFGLYFLGILLAWLARPRVASAEV